MNQDMFAAGLMRGEIDAQSFIDQITTHESFFLRHKRSMELAVERVVRPLIKKGIKPRILSAPCAQGEEPYAMAMLLQDRGINPSQVEITGVDIAENAIKQAKSGLYMDYSVRKAPQSFINGHFKRMADGKLQVHPAVKKAVKFIRINLLTQADAFLVQGFHIIFCHNLLIYFDDKARLNLLTILDRLLHHDGWLFVDATEAPYVHPVFKKQEGQGFTKKNKNYKSQAKPLSSIPVKKQQFPQYNKTISSSAITKDKNICGTNAGDKYLRAGEAYREKLFDESIGLYEQLIKNHPLWIARARLGKAKILLDCGEKMAAMEEADLVLNGAGNYTLDNNDRLDAHIIMAIVLKDKRMISNMEAHKKQIEILSPNHELLRIL